MQTSNSDSDVNKVGYCSFCSNVTEECSDDVIYLGWRYCPYIPISLKSFLALTCLAEFVKKNPIKAAPLLPVILTQFSYRALEPNIQLSQIARHLLRAIYQQLRPHKVMCTVFCAKLPENVFITLGQV